ncbi:MAG: type VI secretion system tube protein Hcp [Azoarcus sp.]|jgi:type VI secretion system secreted protein Hcp|nr:type VI secretion system tube protein Hcp [Azoarcus sp.]
MDIYVKLDGITGESKDAKHKGWIDVLTISYDVSQSSSMNTGGGGGVGRADFTPVTFGHHVDRASPALFKYCAAGKHIPKVEISACKAGGGAQEALRITLGDVLVTNVSPRGAAGALWTESVSLSYSTISIDVKEQKADGSMSAGGVGAWDIKQNKEC